MPRTMQDAQLTTRTARDRLASRHAPYWRSIGAGAALGYRKGAQGGVWLVRVVDRDAGGGYRQAALADADDTLKAAADVVLDYRQAETKAREWVARHQRVKAGLEPEPEAVAAKPYTVADALADYMADYNARGGKGIQQTNVTVEAHIKPALGALAVGRLTRDRIKTWHRALAEVPARVRAKAGAAPKYRPAVTDPDAQRRRRSTANRILTVLKAALNHAKAEGKVTCPADPWASVKPFRETEQPKVRYLLEDEATRLVNACPWDFRELVLGALLTGARYGELTRMTAGDFDPQAATITIGTSKGGKARHVFLSGQGVALFSRLAAARTGKARLFEREAVAEQATKDKPAEYRRVGWAKSDQFRLVRHACSAARITPAIGFHILRHTYASRLAMRGVPIPVIAAQLGHSDTRMTERYYAHLAPTYVGETVRRAFGSLDIAPVDDAVVALRVGA